MGLGLFFQFTVFGCLHDLSFLCLHFSQGLSVLFRGKVLFHDLGGQAENIGANVASECLSLPLARRRLARFSSFYVSIVIAGGFIGLIPRTVLCFLRSLVRLEVFPTVLGVVNLFFFFFYSIFDVASRRNGSAPFDYPPIRTRTISSFAPRARTTAACLFFGGFTLAVVPEPAAMLSKRRRFPCWIPSRLSTSGAVACRRRRGDRFGSCVAFGCAFVVFVVQMPRLALEHGVGKNVSKKTQLKAAVSIGTRWMGESLSSGSYCFGIKREEKDGSKGLGWSRTLEGKLPGQVARWKHTVDGRGMAPGNAQMSQVKRNGNLHEETVTEQRRDGWIGEEAGPPKRSPAPSDWSQEWNQYR